MELRRESKAQKQTLMYKNNLEPKSFFVRKILVTCKGLWVITFDLGLSS